MFPGCTEILKIDAECTITKKAENPGQEPVSLFKQIFPHSSLAIIKSIGELVLESVAEKGAGYTFSIKI